MDQQETVETSIRCASVSQNERGSSLFIEEVKCVWKGELHETSFYNDASMMSYMMEDTTKLTLEMKNVPVLGDPSGHPPDVEVSDLCATSSTYLNIGVALVFPNDAHTRFLKIVLRPHGSRLGRSYFKRQRCFDMEVARLHRGDRHRYY
ncbi:hypothetical protein Tco_0286188 [Tanacetum coccineum]